MPRSPAADGAPRCGADAPTEFRALAALALLLTLGATAPVGAEEALAPGAALHEPRPMASPERVLDRMVATTDAEALYAYTTPFAEPRWLRLQQNGTVVWGTIDINDSFGFCARTRVDGWISGDTVTFDVDLTSTPCPCSGAHAKLRFTGVVDGLGGITGTWTNNCTPPTGSWSACRSADPPAGGVCDPLPENDPPYPIALVPAVGGLALAALGIVLSAWALFRLGRRRSEPSVG